MSSTFCTVLADAQRPPGRGALDRRLLDNAAFEVGKSAVLSAICGFVSAKPDPT
jgi:hypothetical protein